MKKIKCFFVDHKWEYNIRSVPPTKTCLRCGKRKSIVLDAILQKGVEFMNWLESETERMKKENEAHKTS